MSLQVSVVIPTFLRPELLHRCLLALSRQTLPSAAFEIIVVDDGNCQRTRELVGRWRRRLADLPMARYILAEDTQGPAAARNKGWQAAMGGVIAFTDDDTIPDREWLVEGLKALRPEMAAVTGRVVVPTPRRPTDFQRMTHGLEKAEFVTANVFVRREALRVLGGFDERFKRAWREDSDLQFNILRAGWSIGWAPEARVQHPARPAPWGVSLGQQRNVFFDALLYKKHPRLYRLKIRWLPPLRYYAVVLAVLLALGALLSGHAVLGVLASLLALALCLGFALRRLKGASHAPRHVAEMVLTSLLIPFLAVFWRLAGAWHFRVLFL